MKKTITRILALVAAFVCGGAWADAGDVISIDVGGNAAIASEQVTLAGNIPVAGWIKSNTVTLDTLAVTKYNLSSGQTTPIEGANVSWVLSSVPSGLCSVGSFTFDNACAYFKSGLCRGNAGQTDYTITVSGIPFDYYQVYVYFTYDSRYAADTPFPGVVCNGVGYSVSNGVMVRGNSNDWGTKITDFTAPAVGVNAMSIPSQTGSTLTLAGDTTAGAIAAVQIVEMSEEEAAKYPIYSNQLAGSETVPAGTYGAITIKESTGGYKATAYTSNTGLSGTGVGSFASVGLTKNGRKMIDTHTIAGWFKVDALPTGDATKDIFVMRTGTDNYNGYKVAVDANGVLKIGRTNYNNGNYSWNDNKRVSLTGASGAIASGTWFHLAVAFTYDSNGSYWHLTPVAWINGVAASKSGDDCIDINLNGPGYVDDIRIGANISAAGVYVNPLALSSADVIKTIATDSTYVRAANSVVRATLSDDVNFSEISWVGGVAPKAGDAAEITLEANVALTLDAAIAADSVKVIGADKILTLSGSSLDATNFAKFDFSDMTGKVVFSEDCTLIPATGPANGVVYRFEKDYSTGVSLPNSAGTYEFKNAKIDNRIDNGAVIVQVQDDDTLVVPAAGQNQSKDFSYKVLGGAVQIGTDEGSDSLWFGKTGISYEQAGGNVTVTANGTNTNAGQWNGMLLGWSGAMTKMNISGGTFTLANSAFNFWSASSVINVSESGHVKAKGVFAGSGSNHGINLSGSAIFELGSLNWTTIPLTMNGGTFKAYETATMGGAITVSAPSTIEVESGTVLTVTGAVTGSSRDNKITKTGEGTLVLGEQRPVLDIVAGKVRLTATSDELAAGELVLPIPANASAVADTKVEVYNANGDQMTITGVEANAEGTQVTVTLQVNAAITDSCNISDKVTDSTTGVVLIKGPTGESDPITINFDRADYPQGVSFQVTGNVAFTGTVPTTIISYDAAVVYVMSPMTFSVPTGVTAIVKGTVNGDVTLSGAGTIKAADGAVVNGNLNVTGNKFTLEGDLTLGGTGDSHIKGLTGGQLIKTGSGYLKLNNGTGNGHDGYDRYAIDGTTIQIDNGMVKVYNENGDARMYNPSFVIGANGRLENYGWIGAKGTLTIENDTDKVIFTNTNGYGEGGKSAELWGGPNIVKTGAGKATLCVGSHTGNGAEPFGTVNVQAGTLALGGTVAATMGAVSGSGKLELNGSTVDYNVNNQTSGLTSHFIAASGTNTMKWKGGAGNGYNQLCSTDTKADPVITINSGATLNIYGHDYSGWNGNLNEHGWLINNGILVFQSESGTRFFRDHIVFGNGATMKIDHAGTPLLLYGGTGSETSSQFMLESGTASIVAGQAGDNAKIHLGNSTAGGYGDKGMGISVGSSAVLTIEVPVAGNSNSGETIAKWGAGRVNFTKDMSGLNGNITLKAGSIGIHSDCNLADGKIVKDDANMKIEITTEGDYTVYTLVLAPTAITPDENGLVISVAGVTIEKDGEVVEGANGTIPNDTGVYTVVKDGATIAEVAVIKVKDAETGAEPAVVTTAVAVPFASLNGGAITVDSLLNKALLNAGDQLMMWTGSAYNAWQLNADKAWEGVAVVKGTGDNQVTIATAGGASTSVLPRGSAVWVKSAGKVVVYGTQSSSETPTIAEGVMNLLGNTAMEAATPVAQKGDIVEIPGDTTGVRQYKKTVDKTDDKTDDGWEAIKVVVTTTGETIAGLPVKESQTVTTNDPPKVPAGRGYFLKRPAAE